MAKAVSVKTLSLDKFLTNVRLADTHRFVLWLGAGASVPSGIPHAYRIILDVLNLQRNHERAPAKIEPGWEKDLLHWAQSYCPKVFQNSRPMYDLVMAHVLEAKAREDYLRSVTRKVAPSHGYLQLGKLMERGEFRFVATTNFDDLVLKGLHRVSDHGLAEINNNDLFKGLDPMSQDLHLVRLHGDFAHANLANTSKEQNSDSVVGRLDHFRNRLLQSLGLIVIGYSGGDRIIRQKIFGKSRWKHDYLKHGIYWCHMKGRPPADQILEFLEAAPTERAHLVEIPGFDDLMQRLCDIRGIARVAITTEDETRRQWQQQAVTHQLVKEIFRGGKPGEIQQQQKSAAEKVSRLVGIEQLAVVRRSQSGWQLMASYGLDTISDGATFSSQIATKVAGSKREMFTPDEGTAHDRFFHHFPSKWKVKVLPLRRKEKCVGFVVASAQDDVPFDTHGAFLKHISRLLVALPDLR